MVARNKLPPRLDVQWQGVFEGYARKYVERNYWRVSATFPSKEDALQEAALIWVRCYNYYSMTVDNPAWFMSLYKMALANDWHTFATKASRRREVDAKLALDIEATGGAEAMTLSEGPLAALLAGASAELRQVLAVISKAPADVLDFILTVDPKIGTRRLRRMCGIKNAAADPLAELKKLLS